MADNKYNETLARLRAYGQEHLLDGYETLTGAEQAELLKDIDGADLAQMAELYRKALRHQQGGEVAARARGWATTARKARSTWDCPRINRCSNSTATACARCAGPPARTCPGT